MTVRKNLTRNKAMRKLTSTLKRRGIYLGMKEGMAYPQIAPLFGFSHNSVGVYAGNLIKKFPELRRRELKPRGTIRKSNSVRDLVVKYYLMGAPVEALAKAMGMKTPRLSYFVKSANLSEAQIAERERNRKTFTKEMLPEKIKLDINQPRKFIPGRLLKHVMMDEGIVHGNSVQKKNKKESYFGRIELTKHLLSTSTGAVSHSHAVNFLLKKGFSRKLAENAIDELVDMYALERVSPNMLRITDEAWVVGFNPEPVEPIKSSATPIMHNPLSNSSIIERLPHARLPWSSSAKSFIERTGIPDNYFSSMSEKFVQFRGWDKSPYQISVTLRKDFPNIPREYIETFSNWATQVKWSDYRNK